MVSANRYMYDRPTRPWAALVWAGAARLGCCTPRLFICVTLPHLVDFYTWKGTMGLSLVPLPRYVSYLVTATIGREGGCTNRVVLTGNIYNASSMNQQLIL